jgi:hypothetical protein
LDTADLDDADRVFTFAPEEIAALSPNTGSLPIFRTRRDADLTAAIYSRMPILSQEAQHSDNPWNISFVYLFRSANDGDLLRTREQLFAEGWELHENIFTRGSDKMMPLYEAKMVDFFNHRAADVVKSDTAVSRQNQPRYLTEDELRNPARLTLPMYWVPGSEVIRTRRKGKLVEVPGIAARLHEAEWDRDWLCGWCDVTASTNERSAIPAFIPRTAALNTYPLMFPQVSPVLVAALVAAQSSLVFDFTSRQKISDAHMKLFIWKQLPVPTPAMLEPHIGFVIPRVLELVYTAYDLTPLARDLGDGDAPFVWDGERRAQIRAELDAFFFRLYGIERDDVDYIMETFQTESGGLKNNDIAKYGAYRTKDMILDVYDLKASADAADVPYETTITPPPGDGPRHPARKSQ